jgi:chaperonin cofactor prefoldin
VGTALQQLQSTAGSVLAKVSAVENELGDIVERLEKLEKRR